MKASREENVDLLSSLELCALINGTTTTKQRTHISQSIYEKRYTMYTVDCFFYPLQMDAEFIEQYGEAISELCRSWMNNGQQAGYAIYTAEDERYSVRMVIPEVDALNEKNDNQYVVRDRETVLTSSRKAPEYRIIGKNDNCKPFCQCDHPSFYVLLGDYNKDGESPVQCGDCDQSIMIYRLPKTYDNSDYWNLLQWKSAYEAYEKCFMQGVGERYSYRMLHNPKSQLSQDGRSLCALLEEKVNKPVYYYLMDYYKTNKKSCPICGQAWQTTDQHQAKYKYQCKKCKVISR